MNSVASTVRAFSGNATPNVKPPKVDIPPAPSALSGTFQVSKVMPVVLSVYRVGALAWPEHCRTSTPCQSDSRQQEHGGQLT